jgi:hypothetical protein
VNDSEGRIAKVLKGSEESYSAIFLFWFEKKFLIQDRWPPVGESVLKLYSYNKLNISIDL